MVNAICKSTSKHILHAGIPICFQRIQFHIAIKNKSKLYLLLLHISVTAIIRPRKIDRALKLTKQSTSKL